MSRFLSVHSLVAAFLMASLTAAQDASRNPPASETAQFDDIAARADAAHAANRLDEAVALYEKGLTLRPEWLEGHLGAGGALYGLDRCEEALHHLRAFTEKAPEASGAAWALEGLCAFQVGEYQQAFDDLQRGRSMGFGDNPQLVAVTKFHVALLLVRSGQFEHAFKILETFALHEERTPSVIVALGLTILRLPYLPTEVPEDKREMVLLAGAAGYEFARSTPEARSAFETLVSRYPNEASAHYALGVYLISEDPAAAVPALEEALRLEPGHVAALLQLAFHYLDIGKEEAALPYAERAVRQDPQFFAAHLALGRCLTGKGDVEGAVKALEEAARLAPDSPHVFFHLARAYHAAGRAEDSKKARETFSALDEAQRAPSAR